MARIPSCAKSIPVVEAVTCMIAKNPSLGESSLKHVANASGLSTSTWIGTLGLHVRSMVELLVSVMANLVVVCASGRMWMPVGGDELCSLFDAGSGVALSP